MSKIVLSLCDLTGNMVRPWAKNGFHCVCVDVQHTDPRIEEFPNGGRIDFIYGDVRFYLPPKELKIVFAFPPCTNLAVSGSGHFKEKGIRGLIEGLELVERCRNICDWANVPWMLENPVSTISSYWRKPDYIFNPCDYGGYLDPPGDAYTKKTCLWTGGEFKMPPPKSVEPIKVCPQGSWIQRLGGKSDKTKNLRSATPGGFATAVFLSNGYVPEYKVLQNDDGFDIDENGRIIDSDHNMWLMQDLGIKEE